MRRAHLDGFHDPRDGERITREDDRMPVVRQENPGRQGKMVFLSPFPHHAGQALEFRSLKLPSARQEPASDEEKSVGHDQVSQAGHAPALYARLPTKGRRVSKGETLRYRIPLSQKGCHATLDSNTSAPCPVRRSSRRRQ